MHQRIVAEVSARPPRRGIDAGCGAGGTIFYLQSRLGGEYDGLTLSPAQCERARTESRKRHVEDVCRFHVRSYDEPLSAIVPEGADLVIAIESLAHADDPARTIQNLAATLRSGGRLAIVDDVPDERLSSDDADFKGFRDGWQCQAILKAGAVRSAIERAGLRIDHEEDLTPLVTSRASETLVRLVRVNRGLRVVLGWTPASVVLDGLWGGLLLERLYQRGLMSYRFIVATAASA